MLLGHSAEHFAAPAPAIAYHLGVAEVRVVPLYEPSLIRLDLLPLDGGYTMVPTFAG